MKLLSEARHLNPDILQTDHAILLENHLGFRPEWGLGSSSSLTSNLAAWFRIDAYNLFRKTQQGSAYDIACANATGPIWYRLLLGSPVIQRADFNPAFKDKLAFVYSGRKQDSSASVNEYLKTKKISDVFKAGISHIGRDICNAGNLNEFSTLLDEHEDIMSNVLGLPTIKSERFPGFPGSIKSLGAWGGDFFLAASDIGYNEIKSYFRNKDLKICFPWDDLILNRD